jgi:hypothetical protein
MNRYKFTEKTRKEYKTINLPKIKESLNDIYIITKDGDRLDLLAKKYYKDSDLW